MSERRSGTYTATESAVRDFARRWPCFGVIREITATFDTNGDLVDLSDTAGMDETGVAALVADLQAGLL